MRKKFQELLELIKQESYCINELWYIRNCLVMTAEIAPETYLMALIDIIGKKDKTKPLILTKEEFKALEKIRKESKEFNIIKEYETLD